MKDTIITFLLAVLVPMTLSAERVLIPVAFLGEMAGGYGSRWTVQVHGYNASDRYIRVKPFGNCSFGACPAIPADARSAFSISPYNGVIPGGGLFIYVDDPDHEAVRFNVRIHDVSRQDETWGTELPVVRESEISEGTIVDLLELPRQPGFRTTLRIYDFAAVNAPVIVRLHDDAQRTVISEEVVPLSDAGRPLDVPSQAALNDFGASLGTGTSPVRVEIIPTSPEMRIWAFATVTHNETQHVTTLTPQ